MKPWTPRLPEPLPAVLVGAGFFLFMAAFARLAPYPAGILGPGPAGPAVAAAPLARTAERVLGASSAGGGPDVLIGDLAWLRAQGAGLIVLEAWLDEPPQDDARAVEAALSVRLKALSAGRARKGALQALSETAASLDASARLSAALKGAQPLLLAFRAVPGAGALPATIQNQAYGVSLRGETKTPPAAFRALLLPFDGALRAASGVGAVPVSVDEPRSVAPVLGMGGKWFNSLGLEAARLALGLPLDGLRYRWTQGSLSSLQVMNARYPFDKGGNLILTAQGPDLPSVSIDALKGDPAKAGSLRGKTVFYRPWPASDRDARDFDQQGRLFAALTEGGAGAPPVAGRDWAWPLWAGLALGLGLAYAPLWPALVVWAALTASAVFQGLQAGALVCAAAALLLGLGWRLQRRRVQALAAERLLRGVVAPGRQGDWWRRLRTGVAALPGSYAVIAPRVPLEGAPWEAWMERWGALVDEGTPSGCLGLLLAEPGDAAAMAAALLDLRRESEGLSAALARGTLSLRVEHRLGAPHWTLQGPAKEQALELLERAKEGQIILFNKDFSGFSAFVEGRTLEPRERGEAGSGPDSIVAILGPKTSLWTGRP